MENNQEPKDFQLNLLLETLLAMVRERSLEGVFQAGRRYFLKRPHVAATGTWLAEEDAKSLTLRWSEFRTSSSPREWKWGHNTLECIPYSHPLLGVPAKTRRAGMVYGTKWKRPEWAEREGIKSCLVLPMVFKGELVGVLGIFFYPAFEEGFRESTRWLGILADYLAAAIANARAFETIDRLSERLKQENEYLREEIRRGSSYDRIVGQSRPLQRILTQIEIVAPTDASVLVTGESGTGKELIARAIHDGSKRADQPFIKVNCAAVPRDLFESEFFGHARGAFTGAVKERTGRFQLADGGTLLLDEVGEIPLELQGKLLRVLQEGEFERVGEEKTRRVSVRVVAVTNRDLRREVEKGRFREDLFFRLGVFPIEVPPLRQRQEDIPLLTRHFIAEAVEKFGLKAPVVRESDFPALMNYPWPGNIRELQNAVDRAVITAQGGLLDFSFLPMDRACGEVNGDSFDMNTPQIIPENHWKELQRLNILRALQKANWRIQGDGGASELLGLKPTTLRSRMQALGIKT